VLALVHALAGGKLALGDKLLPLLELIRGELPLKRFHGHLCPAHGALWRERCLEVVENRYHKDTCAFAAEVMRRWAYHPLATVTADGKFTLAHGARLLSLCLSLASSLAALDAKLCSERCSMRSSRRSCRPALGAADCCDLAQLQALLMQDNNVTRTALVDCCTAEDAPPRRRFAFSKAIQRVCRPRRTLAHMVTKPSRLEND